MTDRRAVREEDVQRRRIAFQAAQARLNEAKSQLALLKAGAWAPDIAVARSDVAQADAQVKEVRTNIERLTMTARMDGVILQKRVRPGQFAECGPTSEPLMIMGGGPHLNIRADIDEADAWRVRPNTTAVAYVRGDTRERLPLQFVRFEPYVLPKKSLTGDATERVDTRVLQAIYRTDDEKRSLREVDVQQVLLTATETQSGPRYRIYLLLDDDLLQAIPYLSNLKAKRFIPNFDLIFSTMPQVDYARTQTLLFIRAYSRERWAEQS